MPMSQKITVQTHVNAPIEKIWPCWTEPAHMQEWCSASADWHAPRATNDFREGGTFSIRMEAKDGSFGFDFEGTYKSIKPHESIEYVMSDGRTVVTIFSKSGDGYEVTQTFDAETENSLEQQKGGWQAILDNFKAHVESQR